MFVRLWLPLLKKPNKQCWPKLKFDLSVNKTDASTRLEGDDKIFLRSFPTSGFYICKPLKTSVSRYPWLLVAEISPMSGELPSSVNTVCGRLACSCLQLWSGNSFTTGSGQGIDPGVSEAASLRLVWCRMHRATWGRDPTRRWESPGVRSTVRFIAEKGVGAYLLCIYA